MAAAVAAAGKTAVVAAEIVAMIADAASVAVVAAALGFAATSFERLAVEIVSSVSHTDFGLALAAAAVVVVVVVVAAVVPSVSVSPAARQTSVAPSVAESAFPTVHQTSAA